MNRLITDMVDRGRPAGMLDRLRGAAPLEPSRQDRLNLQMANYESALKRGDEVAAGIADHQISKLLYEARAEREHESNVGQTAEPEPAPSWDGGVRRPAPRKREPLRMGDAIKAELDARAQIRARSQDAQRAWRR